MTILVTGARGNIGSGVVARLAAAGQPVRAAARQPDSLRPPAGVEAVSLDLAAPRELPTVLDGVRAVFLFPTRPVPVEFLAAARAAGVEYVVVLSSPDVYEGAAGSPIRVAHEQVEQAVLDSGLPHTVLYPGWLATNARRDWSAQIRATGRVGLACPDAQLTPIHLADIAEVAASLLAERGYPGRRLMLTGPESLRLRDMVAMVGEVLGRPIAVDELGRDEALARRPEWLPAAVLSQLLDVEAASVGVPAPVNNSVERLTGHPARPFRAWIEENRADFT